MIGRLVLKLLEERGVRQPEPPPVKPPSPVALSSIFCLDIEPNPVRAATLRRIGTRFQQDSGKPGLSGRESANLVRCAVALHALANPVEIGLVPVELRSIVGMALTRSTMLSLVGQDSTGRWRRDDPAAVALRELAQLNS